MPVRIMYSLTRVLFRSFVLVACFVIGGCSEQSVNQKGHIQSLIDYLDTKPYQGLDERMRIVDSAFRGLPKPAIVDQLVFYDFAGGYYYAKKMFENAVLCADSIIAIAEKNLGQPNMGIWYAKGFTGKGDSYMRLKRYNQSFDCYNRARNIRQQYVADTCWNMEFTGRQGNLLFVQKNYRKAAAYFIRATVDDTICQKDPFVSFVYQQGNLDNAGIAYAKIQQLDSAEWYYNAALNYIARNEIRFPDKKGFIKEARAVINGNLAFVYAAKKEYSNAEALYLNSIETTGGEENTYTQSLQIELVSMYTSQKEYQKASAMLKVLEGSVRRIPDEDILLKYYTARKDYHLALNDKNTAADFMHLYVSLRDSIQRRDENFSTTDVVLGLENMLQKSVNENLIKSNKLTSSYLALSIVVLVSVIILSFVLWRYTRAKARLGRALAVTHERQRISKELHDDLGTGLTSLQLLVRKLKNDDKDSSRNYDTYKSITQIANELTDQMGEIVWVNSNTDDSVSGLLARLRLYIADYIEMTGLPLGFAFSNSCTDNYRINNIQYRNLFLVVKETFHNTIKHAQAGKYAVDCSCSQGKLTISIRDDGKGFKEGDQGPGNGMANMRSRIAVIGGEISIRSDMGTHILISVPLDAMLPKA